jgi:hypothetical protein
MGQGGAPYEMNDLEADGLFVLYNWRTGGRKHDNITIIF